ncbi:TlpA family protein disulfide reductase [Luteimonas sp. MC1782]|uniref:TlpA family protein disulfide reductase n=1 Tax=Luteimonas sp. MC1782 TaxID=2760305 RepID=UPI00160285B1|nr:TlpA disulfide reductase family protein [Luteimonas sp. MC1782]MBB1473912.1 TlpA family protein disulfide reductase [Luteimonas sp. MC1782]
MRLRPLYVPCLALTALLALAACRPDGGDAPATTGDTTPAAAPPGDATAPPAAVATDEAGAGDSADAAFPTLEVTTLDGGRYTLAERRGRWVVVNFWATWCAPCIKEMPELSALDAMREHIEVVGLAYEDIAVEDMRVFLDRHPVVYPVAILDVYDPPKDFATPRGLPLTYLIAPDGRVAEKFLGPVTAAELEAAITAAGGPGTPAAPAAPAA